MLNNKLYRPSVYPPLEYGQVYPKNTALLDHTGELSESLIFVRVLNGPSNRES